MLKIGEFSKLSRVSVRMLRHYDEIGLLKPQSTDRFTSYRYYKEEQLVTVGRITSLKSLGFSLAEIAEILVIFDDTETLDGYLAKKQAEQAALLAGVTQTLRLLETARTRLRKEQNMSYNVTVKTLPERYAACVRMTIPSYEAEGILWKTLCDETDHMHLIPDDPCYCSVLFHDNEYKEANVDVEAQKTVKGSYPDTEHVRFKTLPPVTFASVTYKGSYDKINEVNSVLAAWVDANGYTPCGTAFNIYHISPHETDNPEEFVTEVCYPVKKEA